MKIVNNFRAHYRGIDFCFDVFEDGSDNRAEREAHLAATYPGRLKPETTDAE